MSTVNRVKNDMATDLMDEVTQRSRRMNSLIVSGIPELSNGSVAERKESDRRNFQQVIEAVGLTWNQKFGGLRIGKFRQDRPRMLKVSCPDLKMKYDIHVF